jgi:hypothetical protein
MRGSRSIARTGNAHQRPVLGRKRLRRRAVARVTSAAGRLLVRLVAEMLAQLRPQRPLDQPLRQDMTLLCVMPTQTVGHSPAGEVERPDAREAAAYLAARPAVRLAAAQPAGIGAADYAHDSLLSLLVRSYAHG